MNPDAAVGHLFDREFGALIKQFNEAYKVSANKVTMPAFAELARAAAGAGDPPTVYDRTDPAVERHLAKPAVAAKLQRTAGGGSRAANTGAS